MCHSVLNIPGSQQGPVTCLSERGSRTSSVLSSNEDLLPSLRHCWLLKTALLLAVVTTVIMEIQSIPNTRAFNRDLLKILTTSLFDVQSYLSLKDCF